MKRFKLHVPALPGSSPAMGTIGGRKDTAVFDCTNQRYFDKRTVFAILPRFQELAE